MKRPLGEIEKPGIPAGLPPWGLVGYSLHYPTTLSGRFL